MAAKRTRFLIPEVGYFIGHEAPSPRNMRAWTGHLHPVENAVYSTSNGQLLSVMAPVPIYGMLRFSRVKLTASNVDAWWGQWDFGAEMAVLDGITYPEVHFRISSRFERNNPEWNEAFEILRGFPGENNIAQWPLDFPSATRTERYIVTQWGTIIDITTNLEWFVGPDQDTDHFTAESWVKKLHVAGGGWRLPTTEELRSIYEHGASERNLNPIFQASRWLWIWSIRHEKYSSHAWLFDFYYGSEDWCYRGLSLDRRAFALRSGGR